MDGVRLRSALKFGSAWAVSSNSSHTLHLMCTSAMPLTESQKRQQLMHARPSNSGWHGCRFGPTQLVPSKQYLPTYALSEVRLSNSTGLVRNIPTLWTPP